MDFTMTNEKGEGISFLRIPYDMDIDIGNTNDYVLNVSLSEWQAAGYKTGCRFFVPGTEYGGIIQNIQTEEGSDAMTVSGDIWRGMLAKKIIEPPAGQDYRKVSGEANAILKSLIDGQFGNLFKVSDVNSGITVKTYQFDRYTDMLTGIVKMLMSANARLQIKYIQGPPNGVGHVEVGAVRIKELNEEYSQDTKVSFSTKDVQNGINHLICLGKGELKDRQVVHLYADGKGNISQTQTFTGLSERTSTYDYSSAETLDDLIKGGTERLKELINYKQFDMTVDEAVADIGDIVGGREYTTGFLIKQQITQKILRASNDSWSVEFKVGGSIKSSQPIGGGGVDYGAQIDSVDAAVKALDKSNTEAHNALLDKDIKLQEQINALSTHLIPYFGNASEKDTLQRLIEKIFEWAKNNNTAFVPFKFKCNPTYSPMNATVWGKGYVTIQNFTFAYTEIGSIVFHCQSGSFIGKIVAENNAPSIRWSSNLCPV